MNSTEMLSFEADRISVDNSTAPGPSYQTSQFERDLYMSPEAIDAANTKSAKIGLGIFIALGALYYFMNKDK